MKPAPFIRSEAQRAQLNQLRALLDENGVPKPHIIWISGRALAPLLEKIGKPPFWKDGAIHPDQLYRYNLCTGRFRKAEPFNPDRKPYDQKHTPAQL